MTCQTTLKKVKNPCYINAHWGIPNHSAVPEKSQGSFLASNTAICCGQRNRWNAADFSIFNESLKSERIDFTRATIITLKKKRIKRIKQLIVLVFIVFPEIANN